MTDARVAFIAFVRVQKSLVSINEGEQRNRKCIYLPINIYLWTITQSLTSVIIIQFKGSETTQKGR